MDFELNDTQQAWRDSVERFARDELQPNARANEAAHDIPHDVLREMASLGLLGVNVPSELGGAEAGVVAYALAVRAVGAADASVAVTMAVSNMVAEVITQFGTPEQRAMHVPKITSGEYYGGAFALSEPGAGSDAAGLKTRAERKGDRWLLNGEKLWITTGDRAGVTVVWARTGGPGAKGISCFLLPANTPGVSFGKPEEKMGLRASHTVAVNLQDVELPLEARIGEEGHGFRLAMMALDGGRIGVGSQACGIGFRALELASRYAKERQQFGEPIASHQGVQFALADMATDMESAWLLTLRAAWLKENKRSFSREAAMAKVVASEAANRTTRAAVQVLGGYGFMEEYEVARLMRDCRVTQIYEGTSEVQRVVISREVLRTGVL